MGPSSVGGLPALGSWRQALVQPTPFGFGNMKKNAASNGGRHGMTVTANGKTGKVKAALSSVMDEGPMRCVSDEDAGWGGLHRATNVAHPLPSMHCRLGAAAVRGMVRGLLLASERFEPLTAPAERAVRLLGFLWLRAVEALWEPAMDHFGHPVMDALVRTQALWTGWDRWACSKLLLTPSIRIHPN